MAITRNTEALECTGFGVLLKQLRTFGNLKVNAKNKSIQNYRYTWSHPDKRTKTGSTPHVQNGRGMR